MTFNQSFVQVTEVAEKSEDSTMIRGCLSRAEVEAPHADGRELEYSEYCRIMTFCCETKQVHLLARLSMDRE